MEAKKEELRAEGDKFEAFKLESDTADQMLEADHRRDIGEERAQGEDEKLAKWAAAIKGKLVGRRMRYKEYIDQCVKRGYMKTVHVNKYDAQRWGGRYQLNGVRWPVKPGYNQVPVPIAESIEATLKAAEAGRWMQEALKISSTHNVIPGVPESLGGMLPAGVYEELLRTGVGGQYSKEELKKSQGLAEKIARGKRADATLPPDDVEYR